MVVTMQCTERDLSEMLGTFFRRRSVSAKELARMIECDPRTAEGFRAGRHWPSAKHWRLIVQAFGRDAIDAVFAPDIDETLARLRREERELEERLNDIRARRQAAAGGEPRADQRAAADLAEPDLNQRDLFEGRQ